MDSVPGAERHLSRWLSIGIVLGAVLLGLVV